jgi:isocitrate lyase
VRNRQTDLAFAGVRRRHSQEVPGKMLAYNCSPSFNWKKNLDESTIAKFQRELGAMGYKYQFITLAGFHSLNYSMFNLAHGYARNNMSAFVELQEAEFAAAEKGFTAVKHQREVGTGYFDAVTQVIRAAKARPRRCMVRRKTNSSSTTRSRPSSWRWDKTTSESLGQND